MQYKREYNMHKANAKHRGIDFEFTFEEWCEMWKPYWHNRGNKPHQYVMSRKGDKGPYSKDNCVIKTWAENRAEQPNPRSLEKIIGKEGIQYMLNNKDLGPTALAKKYGVNRNSVARLIGTQKNRAK